MGLDMFLYVRKKDTQDKIPQSALVEMSKGFYDIDSVDDFVAKIGTLKLYELIKNKNVFVNQHIDYDWCFFSTIKEVGYWRKANAIHRWFVENVQGHADDCGYYVVTREQLKWLKALCLTVLETLDDNKMEVIKNENGFEVRQYKNRDIAQQTLPTQEGFFFGTTLYTESYKDDLEETIQICNNCENVSEDFEFIYHSSW